jgi:gliding motility-associated-like protein
LKNTITSLVLIIIQCQLVYSQNLVSNGGFEENTGLPTVVSDWFLCQGWNSVNNLDLTSNGSHGSPDYYHINGSGSAQLPFGYGGYINAHSGNAIMGMIVEHPLLLWREYISTELVSPLVIGKNYNLTFWISLGGMPSSWRWASDGFGAHLTAYTPKQMIYEPINKTPQMKVNTIVEDTLWRKFSFDFVADSAYTTLTLGHFGNATSNTSMVHPTLGYISSYYYIDDVELTCTSEDCDIPGVSFAPNVITPNNDNVNDYFSVVYNGNVKSSELQILNRWGNIVYSSDKANAKWYGKTTNNKPCDNGVYYWVVTLVDVSGESFKYSGMVHLIE